MKFKDSSAKYICLAKGFAVFAAAAVSSTIILLVYLLLCRLLDYAFMKMLASLATAVGLFFLSSAAVKSIRIGKIAAVISVLMGFFAAYYIHWAAYDYIDLQDNFYTPMKQTTAYEYYRLDVLFPENEDFSDRFDEYRHSYDENGESIWNVMGFDEILGDNAEEAELSLAEAKNFTAFDFTFEYRKLDTVTFTDIVSDPLTLAKDINSINKTGRWKISKSSKYNVCGALLLTAWLAESLLFCVGTVLGALNGAENKKRTS